MPKGQSKVTIVIAPRSPDLSFSLVHDPGPHGGHKGPAILEAKASPSSPTASERDARYVQGPRPASVVNRQRHYQAGGRKDIERLRGW
jgi:hypothetical protein